MKTLFVAYRVTDLDHSLAFYTALGYIELGQVQVADAARIAILKFPDEPVATLELVHRPGDERIDPVAMIEVAGLTPAG
jgi:lactoylglutathione lyase